MILFQCIYLKKKQKMRNVKILPVWVVVCCFAISCVTADKPDMLALTTNENNALLLSVHDQFDSDYINQEMDRISKKSKRDIIVELDDGNNELIRTSILFYYLALSYQQENMIDSAVFYHKVSADVYFNPLSTLKIAQLYSLGIEDYSRDMNIAFLELHKGLELLTEISLMDPSHIYIRLTRDFCSLLQESIQSDASLTPEVLSGLRDDLKEKLPAFIDQFKSMYRLSAN